MHGSLSWLGVALILTLSLKGSSGDFRFCYRGPQRIKDYDCPGGFYAHKPINITCAYYKASNVLSEGAIPHLVQSFCEEQTVIEAAVAGDSIAITRFQEFSIKNKDPPVDPSTLTLSGDLDTPPTACGVECLTQWRDPDEIPPEDHLIDKPTPVETPEVLANNSMQVSKKLFMNLLVTDNYDEDDPHHVLGVEDPLVSPNLNTTQRLSLILSKAMRITIKHCSPFVETDFLRQVLKAMNYLYSLNKKGSVDIGIDEFHVIDDHLTKCLETTTPSFTLVGSTCGTYSKASGIRYFKMPAAADETLNYRITERSFVWGEYDPVIEAAFAVIDFIHGYCFPIFTDNLCHYHIAHTGLEALFPEDPVLHLWANPVELARGTTFWNSVLDTSDIKVAMRNLDACAQAGYAKAPYKHRLERFFTPEDLLATPTYKPIPSDTEAGWTKSIEDYWNWYDKRGGFPVLGSGLGECKNTATVDPVARIGTIKEIISKTCKGVKPPEFDQLSDYEENTEQSEGQQDQNQQEPQPAST